MKIARAIGHEFNCLPGHARILARGTGASASVAVRDAIRNMLRDPRLARRRVRSFKIAVEVTEAQK